MIRPKLFDLKKLRVFLVVVSVIAVSGCAGTSKPSLDLLSQNKEPLYVNSVVIESTERPKTTILLARIQKALASWRSVEEPGGRPVKITILVKKFTHVDAVQSLLIGGSSSISYSVRVTDEAKNAELYQIDLTDRAGYAPGGIIGVATVLGSDEEDELAKKLAIHVRGRVLTPHDISVAKNAINRSVTESKPAKKE